MRAKEREKGNYDNRLGKDGERETTRTRTITIIIEQMAAMTMLTAMVT